MSNDTITIIVYIIIFVWGILNIILFFKIWGMCNNVEKLYYFITEVEEYEQEKSYKNITKRGNEKKPSASHAKPKPNKEDKQELMMSFNEECLRLFRQCETKEEFEEGVDEIVSIYNETGTFDYSTLKEGLWEQFKQI